MCWDLAMTSTVRDRMDDRLFDDYFMFDLF